VTNPASAPDLSRRNLIQGSSLLMGNAILQAVAGFGAQLVLMNLLVPEQFGRYALIAAGIGVAQMLLSLRTQFLIIRAPAETLTPRKRGQYTTVLLIETAAVSVIAVVWLWLTESLDPYAIVLLASLVASQLVAAGSAFMERSMVYRRLATAEAISFFAGYASAIVVALAGAPLAALYGRELVSISIRSALLGRLGAFSALRPHWLGLQDWKSVIREGRDLWAEGLVEGSFSRLLTMGVAACAGQQGLGLFAQSQRLASLPHMVLQPLVSRVAPGLFARLDDRASRLRALFRLCLGLGLVLILAAIAALALAEPLIPPLFGAHWAPAIPVFSALAGVILFTSLFEIGRSYCMMRRMTRVVMAARAVQYAVMIIGFAVALDRSAPATILAGAFSAAMALSFLTIIVGIWRVERPA
jgi:O-antigen/teichoic acid export membrane protein